MARPIGTSSSNGFHGGKIAPIFLSIILASYYYHATAFAPLEAIRVISPSDVLSVKADDFVARRQISDGKDLACSRRGNMLSNAYKSSSQLTISVMAVLRIFHNPSRMAALGIRIYLVSMILLINMAT